MSLGSFQIFTMFFLYVGILCFTLVPSKASVQEESCHTITVCPNLSQDTIGKGVDAIPDYETERIIGKQRHWNGIKPKEYHVNLNFHNFTHYTGNVTIDFEIVQSTNRIMINHGFKNPTVDYSKITVTRCNAKNAPRPLLKTGCVQNATFLYTQETLVLELRDISLEPGENCAISFGHFEGNKENTKALMDGTVRERGFASVMTQFQLRDARTVLPCFDHLSLKAKFNLCVEHHRDIAVASNTGIKSSLDKGGERRLECFKTTPIMSNYLLAFALMINYSSENISMPDGPMIELLAPKAEIAELRWIIENAVPAIRYMQKIASFKYPLDRLAFIVQYKANVNGMENFGLIMLKGDDMWYGDYRYEILYHEIAHQWVGNIMTVSSWGELCLQEGLTTYFERKINTDSVNGSMNERMQIEVWERDKGYAYRPYALLSGLTNSDIEYDQCYARPALVYHVATRMCNFESTENFLAKLIEEVPYGVADIDMYDQALGKTCRLKGTNDLLGPGMIKGWFLQPGPVFLSGVQGAEDSSCIKIEQQVYDGNGNPMTSVQPRPVPVEIRSFQADGASRSFHALMKNGQQDVKHCGYGSEFAFLIDPDDNVFTRKAYTASNYLRILQYKEKNAKMLTDSQWQIFGKDFCNALLPNVLPLANDLASKNPSEWLEVFKLIKTNSGASKCNCCLHMEKENEHNEDEDCQKTRNDTCSKLRLMRSIGMNYTIISD